MIDEILNKAQEEQTPSYDKEAYKEEKREQLKNAFDEIKTTLDELKENPELYKTYLDIQSRFDMYSPRNCLLIAKQKPDAMQLKTYREWKEAGVQFLSNTPENITILEPRSSYVKDGKTFNSFKTKDVIDISDTNAKPHMKNYDKKLILQSLVHISPLPIKAVDYLESGNASELNRDDNTILICRDDNLDKIICSLAKDLALYNLTEKNSEINSLYANNVSYMLCRKYGVETPSYYANMDFGGKDGLDIIKDLSYMKSANQEINMNLNNYLSSIKRDTRQVEQER